MKYEPEFFVATDHFDLENTANGFKDDIPDYQLLNEKIATLKEKSTTKILRGIELGVVPGQEQTILDYLAKHPYDLKLLSIHQNRQFDYMDDCVLKMDKLAVVKTYFDQMLSVLENFPDGHILTHFEYGLRRFDFTEKELETHFEKELTAIFKKVIERELAFEVNAKSFGRYHNAHLYRYGIPLYQSLGGKLFTLGSDAHVADDYQLFFPEMSQLLQEFDVKKLVVFQGKERFMTDLPIK